MITRLRHTRPGIKALKLKKTVKNMAKNTSSKRPAVEVQAVSNKGTSQPVQGSPQKKSYVKKSTATPSPRPGGNGDPNKVLVVVSKTKSDDMIMLLEKANGGIPYVWNAINYLNQNPHVRNDLLHIVGIKNKVSGVDPNLHYQVIAANGFSRKLFVLVGSTDSDSAHLNTTANRRRWADAFIAFYNHPNTQRQFAFPNPAVFSADITPQNEANSPPLSQFLTIRDTMEMIQTIISQNPGELEPIGDVLENEDAMNDYYSPEHKTLARELFHSHLNHVPGNPDARFQQDADYADIQPFQFNP